MNEFEFLFQVSNMAAGGPKPREDEPKKAGMGQGADYQTLNPNLQVLFVFSNQLNSQFYSKFYANLGYIRKRWRGRRRRRRRSAGWARNEGR